jgi:hypothetical protein
MSQSIFGLAGGSGSVPEVAPDAASMPTPQQDDQSATMPESQPRTAPDDIAAAPSPADRASPSVSGENETGNALAGPSDHVKVFQPAPTPQAPSTREPYSPPLCYYISQN